MARIRRPSLAATVIVAGLAACHSGTAVAQGKGQGQSQMQSQGVTGNTSTRPDFTMRPPRVFRDPEPDRASAPERRRTKRTTVGSSETR
jgi:hypothetical protein